MSEGVESNYYPYPERSSNISDETLVVFDKAPEIQLSPEQEMEAWSFEKELTVGEELGEEKAKGIEIVWARKVNTTILFPEYFLTSQGKQSLIDNLGVEAEQLDFGDVDAVQSWLLGRDYSEVDGKVFKKLQGESTDFIETRMVAQFEASGFTNMDEVENPRKMTIVRNPGELATKIREYKALKRYHKELYRQLEKEDGDLGEVKRVLLNIHRRKLNTLLAETYPKVVALARQEKLKPTTRGEQAMTIINDEVGMTIQILAMQDRSGHRSMARINNFIDGVGGVGEGGSFISLGKEAIKLADKLDTQNDEDKSREESTINKLGISRDRLENTIVNAEEMKVWFEDILRSWGILSTHTDYDPDRVGRVGDELWQVVIDDGAKSLSVNSRLGVVKIPKSLRRSVASTIPTGAVAVVDHESTHVLQHENKEKIGLSITKKVGTDRASINFEGGAEAWERKSQKEWFGQSQPTYPHYLRAIQTRLGGGSYKECVQAFFESCMRQKPDADKGRTAKLAVNRSMRIFRREGVLESQYAFLTNSQPLVYIEQELVARKLEKFGQTNLMMVGGLSISTLSELHRVGLLNKDNIIFPDKLHTKIIEEQIIDKIRQ